MDLNITMSRLVLFTRSLVRCNLSRGQPLSTSTHTAPNETPIVPPRPKKPLTPWLMFVRDRKDDLLQRQKMSASELSCELAKEWKHFDKSNYQAEYLRFQQEYSAAKLKYEQSLTPEQKQQLEENGKDKLEKRINKELRRTKPPKLPRNPANFYFAERSSDPDLRYKLGAQSQTEVLSKVFKQYSNLSDEEKEKYVRMQERDKERFRVEFMSWYESVMSDKSVSRLARAKADAMRTRFKLLSYI